MEILLSRGALAVRHQSLPALLQESKEAGGSKLPHVETIARCGHLYYFQVWSDSKDAWVIKGARLEGPSGEELQVNAVGFEPGSRWDVNVIVAEVPSRASASPLTLHLTAENGRVARLEEVALP